MRLILAALPTLALGTEYWPLLLDRVGEQSERMFAAISNLFLMVGPYYLFTLFGLSSWAALQLQVALTILCAVMVLLLWRSRHAGFDAKAAGLLLAILLSAPYLWYYESAAMAVIVYRSSAAPAKKIKFSDRVGEELQGPLTAKDSTWGNDRLIVCTTALARNRSPPSPDEARFTARTPFGARCARNSTKNSTVVR